MTDHRIEVTLYNLSAFLEGDMDCLIEPLMAHDLEQRLAALRNLMNVLPQAIPCNRSSALTYFDCDGTLADTMPLHWRAWKQVTERHGLHFPEDRFYSLGGVPARATS